MGDLTRFELGEPEFSGKVKAVITRILVLLLLVPILSIVPALHAADGDKPPVEKDKKEEDKPKIPPFKYSAWCAFRSMESYMLESRTPNRPQTKDEIEKDTQTRRGSYVGYGKRGHWIKVVVEVQNTTPAEDKQVYKGTIHIRLDPVKLSGEGQVAYSTRYSQEFEIGPQSTQQYPFSVLCPDYQFSDITVNITSNSYPYQRNVSVNDLDQTHDKLILVVSEEAGAFSGLKYRPKGDDDDGLSGNTPVEGRQVAVVRPNEMPDRWHDLTIASLIIIDGPPREGLTDLQITALEEYVRAGGTVLITTGKDPSRLQVREGQKRRLSELAGVEVAGTNKLKTVSFYNPTFKTSTAAQELPILEVKPLKDVGIIDVAKNDETGLVERTVRQVGLGHVTLLSFNLNDKVLESWSGKTGIAQQELGSNSGQTRKLFTAEDIPDDIQPRNIYNWGGDSPPKLALDSVNRLREELDINFEKDTVVDVPPRSTVATFLLFYLLVAVPLNYFMFGWLKRREVAWLAVPVYALIGCWLAYEVGVRGKQGEITVTELSVLEVGSGQSGGVGRTFIGLYSPRSDFLRLDFPAETQTGPGHLIKPTLVASTRGIDQLPELEIHEDGTGMSIENLQINARSTRRLETVHRVDLGDGIQADYKVTAKGQQGEPTAYELKYRNGSKFKLLDATLLVPGQVYHGLSLGDLFPHMGETATKEWTEEDARSWKTSDEAFFGRSISFQSAPTSDARKRRELLVYYVANRFQLYQGPVLAAWVEGGLLPVQIKKKEPGTLRGFSLLLMPLKEVNEGGPLLIRNWAIEYSSVFDPTRGINKGDWNPRTKQDAIYMSRIGSVEAVAVLKCIPPKDLAQLSKGTATLSFQIKTLANAASGRNVQIPTHYKGKLQIRVLERTASGDRWKQISSNDISDFSMGREKTRDVTVSVPYSPSMYSRQALIFDVRILNMNITGNMDSKEEEWPILLDQIQPEYKSN